MVPRLIESAVTPRAEAVLTWPAGAGRQTGGVRVPNWPLAGAPLEVPPPPVDVLVVDAVSLREQAVRPTRMTAARMAMPRRVLLPTWMFPLVCSRGRGWRERLRCVRRHGAGRRAVDGSGARRRRGV